AERLAAAESPAPAPAIAPFTRRRWLSVAAAAVFVLAFLTLILTSPAETPKALANELSVKYKETQGGFCGIQEIHDDDCFCLGDRCNSQPTMPSGKHFDGKVSYEVCSHDLQDLGYQPIGGTVWTRQGGRMVCLTVYHDPAGNSIMHGLVTTKI